MCGVSCFAACLGRVPFLAFSSMPVPICAAVLAFVVLVAGSVLGCVGLASFVFRSIIVVAAFARCHGGFRCAFFRAISFAAVSFVSSSECPQFWL